MLFSIGDLRVVDFNTDFSISFIARVDIATRHASVDNLCNLKNDTIHTDREIYSMLSRRRKCIRKCPRMQCERPTYTIFNGNLFAHFWRCHLIVNYVGIVVTCAPPPPFPSLCAAHCMLCRRYCWCRWRAPYKEPSSFIAYAKSICTETRDHAWKRTVEARWETVARANMATRIR